jgi:ATP-dependent RNA helicase RhlE
MGFIRDIRRVIKMLPDRRQNLMFSATYNDDIRQLASGMLRDPVTVEVAVRNATADRVDQSVYKVPKDHKRHLLAHLIKDGNWFQVLVFTRTKHGANRLTQQLEGAGIKAAAIHGNKSQGARTRALSDFKDNRITALVATEVAARGLDIKELPHVVNYELPNVPEDYVHRIGRTARAGATGQAVSLVSPDEAPLLRDIERLLKRPLQVSAVPEFPISTTPTPPLERFVDPRRAAQNAGRPSRPQGQRRDGRGSGHSAPRHQGSGSGRSPQGAGQGSGNRSSGGQRRGPAPANGQAATAGEGGFRRQRMH